MGIYALIILAIWIVFLLVWFFSALDTKRYARRNFRSWGVRFFIVVILLVIFQFPSVENYFVGIQNSVSNPMIAGVGDFLALLGVGFAIWARMHLGRNWGMPMSLKENPDLVTTGPYAYVRHPIYTGMLLAMLGSALVVVWWIIPFVLFAPYFIWSAKTEEKILLEQFPDQYPAYMARTKMLVPFVF